MTATAIDCARDPADAALSLARSLVAGRRLVVSAPGAIDHAHHVAVEFIHPAVAGARPLPAVALPTDGGGQSGDVRLRIATTAGDAEFFIAADQPNADIVRSYHVLWELVQVAIEHPGLVGADASEGGDATGFLYPFLDAAELDEEALRASLAASAAAKHDDSGRLIAATLAQNEPTLAAAADATSTAVRTGATVYVMGNGGSSTDGARLVRQLGGIGVDAVSLAADYAVLTALANDVGVERIFSRQLEAFARPGDVLIGCSTSGNSPNLLAAFDRGQARGLTTIGLSGYGGQSFATHDTIHHHLAVDSSSVHRIQEAQAALMDEFVRLCHDSAVGATQ